MYDGSVNSKTARKVLKSERNGRLKIPLKFEEAVSDLLKVKPEAKKAKLRKK